MKIWEILKEENIGKKYKDNNDNNYVMKSTYFGNAQLYNLNKDEYIYLDSVDIMGLEFEEIHPKLTGWERAEKNHTYYAISTYNEIIRTLECGNDSDKKAHDNLSYFSLEEKAEEVRDMNLLQRMMLKFYDEEDGQVNWNDGNKRKYSINYEYLVKDFTITQVYTCKKMNEIYFSSEELAQRCIDEVIKPFMEGK